jgi:hypothetical protein
MRCGLRDMDGKLFLETIYILVEVEVGPVGDVTWETRSHKRCKRDNSSIEIYNHSNINHNHSSCAQR